MIVVVDGERREGRALELDGDPETLARAVADDSDDDRPTVRAPRPGPVVRRVSPVTPETSVAVGPALAAAARSRGLEAPQDEAIAEVRAELRALDPPEVDDEPARRRVATAGDRERRLHERVAELRGRLAAHRERDEEPPAALRERLQEAVAELTEVRTDRIAAEEALSRAQRRARRARDERERRLRLQDRRDNLRRAAREHLVERLREPFRDALRAVPGPASPPDPRAVEDDVAAALAVLRVADVEAPAVVACGRFESATAAADALSAPVIRVPP